ncbi:hypothetical protein JYQ62_26265 [Nostoc sp. UHCC 0702]|nr:hypothetical protein JYQ62_26265 [Nostoc sp. UHCC 0702]
MYTTENGKLNHQVIFETFRDILASIKYKIGEEAVKIQHISKDNAVQDIELQDIPIDLLMDYEQRMKLKQILQAFLKEHKLTHSVANISVYNYLLTLLVKQINYTKLSFNISDSSLLLSELKNLVLQEVKTSKIFIIPVVGGFIEKGKKCNIGSIEFVSSLDFIDEQLNLLNALKQDEEYVNYYNDFEKICQNSHIIAKVKIRNKSVDVAQAIAQEAMKRIYAIIRCTLPTIAGKHVFFGAIGEEYLARKYSILFTANPNDESEVKSITVGYTRNHFVENEINLFQQITMLKTRVPWFNHCDFIINKFISGEKLSKFEERVWTAIYWLGEAINERELSAAIIKYATCLEALFNDQKGKISQQVSEFTAYIAGDENNPQIEIYRKVRELYKLRSDAVHGKKFVKIIDNEFLFHIHEICRVATFRMAIYSGVKDFPSPGGYRGFVNYVLKECKFLRNNPSIQEYDSDERHKEGV